MHGKKPKRKVCIFDEGCTNLAVTRAGFCCEHGPKPNPKLCIFEGCTNLSRKGNVCYRHRKHATNVNNLCRANKGDEPHESHKKGTPPNYCAYNNNEEDLDEDYLGELIYKSSQTAKSSGQEEQGNYCCQD